jgi:hypothetical protein
MNLSRQRALDYTATLLSMLLELIELVHLMVRRHLLVALLRRLMLLLLQVLRLLHRLLLVVAMSASLRSLTLQLGAT